MNAGRACPGNIFLAHVLVVFCLVALCWVLPDDAFAVMKKKGLIVKEKVKAPEIYLAAPPQFLQPENEPYFVAIEIPYDLFYLAGTFILNYHNQWFSSDFFEGPWEWIENQKIPAPFRSNKMQQLRGLREQVTRKYLEKKEVWPLNRLFVPETIDDETPLPDEVQNTDVEIPENELPQNSLKLKGDE